MGDWAAGGGGGLYNPCGGDRMEHSVGKRMYKGERKTAVGREHGTQPGGEGRREGLSTHGGGVGG